MASPRVIPSIEQLRQRPDFVALESRYGRHALVEALREETDALRRALLDGAGSASGLPRSPEAAGALLRTTVEARLARAFSPSLEPVINATGVIIHTNLGRAPLAEAALQRVVEVARGYANLEYDLETGRRGRRDVHAEALLTRLTGAEAAVVVNNNAAATLLVLAALAHRREVILSRGELVEIGGGFRVPDVLAQSGAILREVGTTNRTRVADYAAAIGERTALILRVHPSNFRIEGFTERSDPAALVALGRRFGVPVVEDLGSGNVLVERLAGPEAEPDDRSEPAAEAGRSGHQVLEPTVQTSVAQGFDVVCVSGDKLLGGPQAGIVVGRRALVDLVRRHPLMRALRVDKLTYAALEATLIEHIAGRARQSIPVLAMLSEDRASVERRARAVASRLADAPGIRVDLLAGESTVGGGSAPGSALPTCLVGIAVRDLTAESLDDRLRRLRPPVIARIERDRVVLDLRTVLPWQDETLAESLRALAPR